MLDIHVLVVCREHFSQLKIIQSYPSVYQMKYVYIDDKGVTGLKGKIANE